MKDYSALYGREIWSTAGPGGAFSLYRDNAEGLQSADRLVEEQVTATLAEQGYPELYAAVGPADLSEFEPSWASAEEEESGEFPGRYAHVQWGTVWSREDPDFSACFKYFATPMLVRVPERDDLEDAVFAADEESQVIIEEW